MSRCFPLGIWCAKSASILLLEEILHQLISSLSHYLHGFIQPRWCRISSINSIISCAAKMLNRECSDGVGYSLRHLRTTDSSFGPCSCQGCDTCRRCCWASHAAHLTSLRPWGLYAERVRGNPPKMRLKIYLQYLNSMFKKMYLYVFIIYCNYSYFLFT